MTDAPADVPAIRPPPSKKTPAAPSNGPQLVRVKGLGAAVHIELHDVRYAQPLERFLIGLEVTVRFVRCDGGKDKPSAVQATGHLPQDLPVSFFVLRTSDEDKGALAVLDPVI
ncbi:hypothetical protein [Microvirga arabica]|uniref:hypothetical protein n=1 Tax=Microvirga arabica TaxID=1128671 RepID=UPI001FE710F1|nr:hypothetical protein [Microvirga arabica]